MTQPIIPSDWTAIATRVRARSDKWAALPGACVQPEDVVRLKRDGVLEWDVERGVVEVMRVRGAQAASRLAAWINEIPSCATRPQAGAFTVGHPGAHQ